MEPLTPADVQQALDALGWGIRIHFFDTSTATSPLAAEAIGCQLGQIAKSLAFIADSRPVLVIASGDRRVDSKKLAGLLGISHKRVKIAKPEECVTHYGYEPGGVPPLGLRTAGIPVFIDDSLRRYAQVYAAAGAPNAIFPLTLAQLVEASGGQIADVKREEEIA